MKTVTQIVSWSVLTNCVYVYLLQSNYCYLLWQFDSFCQCYINALHAVTLHSCFQAFLESLRDWSPRDLDVTTPQSSSLIALATSQSTEPQAPQSPTPPAPPSPAPQTPPVPTPQTPPVPTPQTLPDTEHQAAQSSTCSRRSRRCLQQKMRFLLCSSSTPTALVTGSGPGIGRKEETLMGGILPSSSEWLWMVCILNLYSILPYYKLFRFKPKMLNH